MGLLVGLLVVVRQLVGQVVLAAQEAALPLLGLVWISLMTLSNQDQSRRELFTYGY